MSDLDKVFAKHQERTEKAKEEAEAARQRARVIDEEAHKLFDSTILPALKGLADDLTERGHASAVTEPQAGVQPIRATLSLRISGSHYPDAKLEFRTGGLKRERKVECSWQITTRTGTDNGDHAPGTGQRGFEHVKPEWIRSAGVKFVEAVLREN